MREERFEVPVAGGVLVGHRGGDGPPALLQVALIQNCGHFLWLEQPGELLRALDSLR